MKGTITITISVVVSFTREVGACAGYFAPFRSLGTDCLPKRSLED